jgi:copper chaperone NosL
LTDGASPRRAAACAALLLALAACRAAEGPEPIAFDREPCAQCRMLISEPAFAAQLQTGRGEVYNFDDPGCLLRFLSERSPDVRALWFHHSSEERWLRETQVAFVEGRHTPMAYGLGAVDAGTAGALDLAEAQARVRARAAGREAAP